MPDITAVPDLGRCCSKNQYGRAVVVISHIVAMAMQGPLQIFLKAV